MTSGHTETALWRHYIHVTKPGIIRANVLTVAAGFLFASRGIIFGLRVLG